VSQSTFRIGEREIGEGHPPYLIAEMSANHLGKLERALNTMEAAKEAGADAVKLQTYTADTITIDHDGPGFRIEGGPWDGRLLHELYQEAHTPWDWHEALFEKGRALGLDVFSSPFDASAIDFLETLDPPAYKIASFEAVDPALIARAAATGKPLIISTGMADRTEIAQAVEAGGAAASICLLHCVSGYPAPAEEANLRTIADLAKNFGLVCGLSDHTLGTAVPIAAVSLGAAVIEKHFTLDRAAGGPDAAFSLEPDEFAVMAQGCRTAWSALGQATYGPTPSEEANLQFRRSLYVVADIAKGEPFTEHNLRSIRPGFGLPPRMIDRVIGQTASRELSRGTPLDHGCVAWPPGAETD
jgi:pseudaminic acid synthase